MMINIFLTVEFVLHFVAFVNKECIVQNRKIKSSNMHFTNLKDIETELIIQ